jgi:hypothetical protein
VEPLQGKEEEGGDIMTVHGTGTPAPQWVQAALSWGREIEQFCEQSAGVTDYAAGEIQAHPDDLGLKIEEASETADRALAAWRSSGAAPVEIADSIATINGWLREIVPLGSAITTYLAEADFMAEGDPGFDELAIDWAQSALLVCHNLRTVKEALSLRLQEMLEGTGESFKKGVTRGIIMSKLEKAGMVLVTVVFLGGLWALSRRG